MTRLNKFFIFLTIKLIFLNSVFLLKANDEMDITANKIIFNDENEIIEVFGDVIVENNETKIFSDNINYYKNDDKIIINKNVKIVDKYNNTYYSEKIETNKNFSKVEGKEIKIRLKDNSRIVGSIFKKKNNINVIKNGSYTPCNENNYLFKNCPGWKLKAGTVFHDEDTKTMHYDHSILYVLNIPVLYTPYFSHPDPSVEKRSGFLAPTIKSDDKLGQSISLPYFYNINSNKDLTFIPTVQTSANNYLTTELRLLNKNGIFNIEANLNDNDDKLGTKHYLFGEAKLESQLNEFEIKAQTSNSDTYMKKNQINDLDLLISGVTISDTYLGNYFLFEAKSYKHLAASNDNQWEYLYPKLVYNITNISLKDFEMNMNINNEILRQRNLDKDKTTNISSLVSLDKPYVDKNYGLVFNSFLDTRITYYSVNYEDEQSDINQIRLFPQIGTIISYPLKKTNNNYSQILKPIIMPILAPYNNYTKSVDINNSNIFSKNRTSLLSEWESGPRINYGAEWFIDYKGVLDSRVVLGQSLRFNKNRSDASDELSDIMSSVFLNLNNNIYSNAEFIIDKTKHTINKSNITSSINFNNTAIKVEYDYVSSNFSDSSEQFGLATKIKLEKDLNFTFSGKRDLSKKENIGYEAGIIYENDCLAINFKYYRDLTRFKDIEDTKGLSFLITLKPFGSSKTFGKSKEFGPQI